jgi:hypothetical protein
VFKPERSDSISSNASSLLSMKRQRKKTRSNHSKAQETIDTAPFTIATPVHSPKIEKETVNIEHNDHYEEPPRQYEWENEREPSAISEIKPEEIKPKTPIPIKSYTKPPPPKIKPEEKPLNDE